MGDRVGIRIPDLLMGLAPAAGATCPRCGGRTTGLANGRGRLDFCSPCGTLELENAEGLTLMSLRDLALPAAVRTALAPGARTGAPTSASTGATAAAGASEK